MKALIAFDKFKHALSASEACSIAPKALGAIQTDLCPLTDGGEGFCEILTNATKHGRIIRQVVTGPLGQPLNSVFGLVRADQIPSQIRAFLKLSVDDGDIAVIEMAQASGLAQVPVGQCDLWRTTSFGTGELIVAAAARGVRAILLGIGGSATNDLGLGGLAALGLQFQTRAGVSLSPPIPAHWHRITSIAGKIPDNLPPIWIACDVSNPLLGSDGATAIYGPQKGLRAEDQGRLEAECARLSALLCTRMHQPLALRQAPGMGAAGGISFGLKCATDARLLPGANLFTAWFDLEMRLAASDVVITGEGRFDDSSLSGKGPGALVRRALELGKETHVFAGQVCVANPPPGLQLHAITSVGTSLDVALPATAKSLAAALRRVFARG